MNKKREAAMDKARKKRSRKAPKVQESVTTQVKHAASAAVGKVGDLMKSAASAVKDAVTGPPPP